MTPQAYIVHRVRGRLRLRLRDKRQDREYFDVLSSRLEAVPGILSVEINANTGSVLIRHPELSYEQLEAELRQLGLFDIKDEAEPPREALKPLLDSASWMNQTVSEGSSGSIDLRSIAVIALVGLAVHQAYRGNILGPAIPLLLSALDLAQQVHSSPSEDGL